MKNLLLLLFVTLPLFAQDFTFDKESGKAIPSHIGELKILKGSAYKDVNGRMEQIKTGTRFFENDVITTKEKSFIKILIVDDSILTVGSNSVFRFSEFHFKDKDDRQATYSLLKGQLRALVKNKAKDGEIVFKTKSSVLGVRGTELLINHQTINSLEVSEFALLSGKAQVSDEKKQLFDIEKSERIIIINDPTNKSTVHEKSDLPQELIQALDDEEAFLPYFEPEKVVSLLKGKTPKHTEDSQDSHPVREKPKKDWQENLKRLNEQLKENQEKKSL